MVNRAELVQAMEGVACLVGECRLLLQAVCQVLSRTRGVRSNSSTEILQGLLEMGIRGVTVSDVRGYGAQGGSTERYEGIGPARGCGA